MSEEKKNKKVVKDKINKVESKSKINTAKINTLKIKSIWILEKNMSEEKKNKKVVKDKINKVESKSKINTAIEKEKINNYIDHTCLKAYATEKDIKKLCDDAIEYSFASVCVNPTWVKFAAKYLKKISVNVCTVIGFPLGANTLKVKIEEAKDAIKNGATEIDYVINIGYLKDKKYDLLAKEIREIRRVTKGKILKVIVETCYLDYFEKEQVVRLVSENHCDFIKTSTGFGTAGADVDDVKLFSSKLYNNLKIKASGGIKNYDDTIKMIKAGAMRIGTSNGIDIVSK